MPYSNVSEAPANIRSLNGASLSLSQVNWIARVADGIKASGAADNAWAVAISQFKKSFVVQDGSWVKRDGSEEKELGAIIIGKESNGRYKIVALSTAAIPDLEDETYSTVAMDHEIATKEKNGNYPEFRLWHNEGLAIGRVTKMTRVGVFAIDSGYAYDDPFSIAVCKMLESERDSGKWRVSRGFYLEEASGNCRNCGESLLIRKEHIILGFRCPVCRTTYLGRKGALSNFTFLKTNTFDVTVTDNPAVPWTSAVAYMESEEQMNKKLLKEKLLEAGLSEEVVDAKLASIPDEILKEFDEITELPTAILKKLGVDVADGADSDAGTIALGAEVLKEVATALVPTIAKIVSEEVQKALADLTFEIPDVELDIPQLKEYGDRLATMEGILAKLQEDDDTRLATRMKGAPRGAAFRIRRYKASADDEEDEEDDEEVPPEEKQYSGVIMGADGRVASTMTAFVLGGK